MLLQTVLLIQTFQLVMPFCHGQVFLKQPGPGPVVGPIGTQLQLNCSVMEGYRIEWGVTLPDQTVELTTDLPGVLGTLRARGIVVESPDNETSLLVINTTESTNGTAATCIAINRNNPLAREESRQVQVLYYIIAPNLIAVEDVRFCLVEDTTYSIQCSYTTGSDVRGCVYTLVSGVEGVANITGIIDRISSEGEQIDLPNVSNFVELLVFDWIKRDNNISSLSVQLNITQPESCEGDSSSGIVITLTIILCVVAVILCAIITFKALIIALSRRCHKKHPVTNKNGCTNNYDKADRDFYHGHEKSMNTEAPRACYNVELELYEKSENNAQTQFPYTCNDMPSQSMEEYLFPVCNMLEGKHESYSHLNFSQSDESDWTGQGQYEDVVVSIENTHYKHGSSDNINSFMTIKKPEGSRGSCNKYM